MEQPNDIWFRRVGIPIALFLANLFYLDRYNYSLETYLAWTIAGILYLLPVWSLSVRWLLFIRKRHTGIDQTRQRVFYTFSGYLAITTISQAVFLYLLDALGLAPTPITLHSYVINALISFGFTVIIGTIYEIIYYLQLYRLAVSESEAVQQASLRTQFDTLKTQVNPHFLFNSLNSLSALIQEDQAQAGLFLDELATVYRYLLQTHEQKLVSLRTELTFIRSFLYLLKTRFGSAFVYDIDVHDNQLERLLPPLTLQVLIESAIKHNIIEVARPLRITIVSEGETLIVTNTIQRKNRLLETQPGGLSDLTTRFQMLKMPPPVFLDDSEFFTVRLPLGKKNEEHLVVLSHNR